MLREWPLYLLLEASPPSAADQLVEIGSLPLPLSYWKPHHAGLSLSAQCLSQPRGIPLLQPPPSALPTPTSELCTSRPRPVEAVALFISPAVGEDSHDHHHAYPGA